MPLNEADTCRLHVTPRLRAAGWETDPHSLTEQYPYTAGRIRLVDGRPVRGKRKRVDYLLRFLRDLPIATVEAKPEDAPEGEGLQQSKDYALDLDLKFAYATNGHWIIEFDFIRGTETRLDAFPNPDELFARLKAATGLDDRKTGQLLTPAYHQPDRPLRYYQQIAIHRTLSAILSRQRRILLCMATGTGKTTVAFQICWRLWNARWNLAGAHRKPRMLFLADRNVLVDDPTAKDFAPFGEARWKIDGGRVRTSREMYFAIYQAIAADKSRPGLYRRYPPDFFDLIIVDECHRGSARDESSWREILEWFQPACQLGMTATPLREDTRDSYRYFGNPIYSYSLRQGIDDGFLAPYRVHRVVTDVDAAGWRPSREELDRYGREIPDELYETKDFERIIALKARTQAIARHLSSFMRRGDRWAKTIVFCVDQEHALAMRQALTDCNSDLAARQPDYCVRVTSDEGDRGRALLGRFQEPDEPVPVILTTSQMLTTGVDAPTCRNVVLVRVINSSGEFKQIIGRGTRIREDYGKTWFNIIDYTGSATERFADPGFDGFPDELDITEIDAEGVETGTETLDPEATTESHPEPGGQDAPPPGDDTSTTGGTTVDEPRPRKYYIDDGKVQIIGHLVYEHDDQGRQLRVVQYTDYSATKVRTLFDSADALRDQWADPVSRDAIQTKLTERGIDAGHLAEAAGCLDADPLDLLCHLAFQKPLRTRRERAEHLRRGHADFFDRWSAAARGILNELLDRYTEHGPEEFRIPDALQVPPLTEHGNPQEIAELFGGPLEMRYAVTRLQALLYQP